MHPDHEGMYIEAAILTTLLFIAGYASFKVYNVFNFKNNKQGG